MAPDLEAVTGAANRFAAFFRELEGRFIERTDLLQQIALALLSREHVLMTGPPGTAKSKLAQAVLGRIVGEETRQPSLFARQFTESTVQTDLVGPIDFKTLMETGRTEHFTDEGMLGAAHAFLDEVFDGRDMLLRSTLNLLHERELKQGTKIARGKIECALMTTNRYLAEVLENERLLAFVDRIAFLNFVPRGFADGGRAGRRCCSGRSAGTDRPPLQARLSIQDLDLLQAAVESVFVSEATCARRRPGWRSPSTPRWRPPGGPIPASSRRATSRRGAWSAWRSCCGRSACSTGSSSTGSGPLEARPADVPRLRLGLTLCGPDLKPVGGAAGGGDRPARAPPAGPGAGRARDLRALPGRPGPARGPGRAAGAGCAAAEGHRAERAGGQRAPTSWPSWRAPWPTCRRAGAPNGGRGPDAAGGDAGGAGQQGAGRGAARPTGPGQDPLASVARLGQVADQVEAASAGHRRLARWLRGRALVAAGAAGRDGSQSVRGRRPPGAGRPW